MESQQFTENSREAGSNRRMTESTNGETTIASPTIMERRIRHPSQAIIQPNPNVQSVFGLSMISSPRTTATSLYEPFLSTTAVGYSAQDDDGATSRTSSNSPSTSHDLPRIRLRERPAVPRSLDSSFEEMCETTDHIPCDNRQRVVVHNGDSSIDRLFLPSPNGNWLCELG
jgi:hypothetical protein